MTFAIIIAVKKSEGTFRSGRKYVIFYQGWVQSLTGMRNYVGEGGFGGGLYRVKFLQNPITKNYFGTH